MHYIVSLSLSHTHTHAVGLFAMMCLDENVALYPAEVVYSSGMITDFAWISRIHTNHVLQNYSVKRMMNYLKHMANDNLYIFTETNSMEILLVSFQTPPLSLSKNDSTPTIISECVALDNMLFYSDWHKHFYVQCFTWALDRLAWCQKFIV